jgi:hypothetical protein
VRTTTIRQRRTSDRIAITIERARGSYAGAPTRRDNVVELTTCGANVTGVTFNGTPLVRRTTEADLDAEPGWYAAPTGLIRMRSGKIDVGAAKRFVVALRP